MGITKEIEKEYTMKSLQTYASPTIGVMIFASIYTMVDGIFVGRYVGATALSAVNIFMPFYALIFAVALMLGTGGSAIIAKKMGEDKYPEARSNFTFIVLSGIVIGFYLFNIVIGMSELHKDYIKQQYNRDICLFNEVLNGQQTPVNTWFSR